MNALQAVLQTVTGWLRGLAGLPRQLEAGMQGLVRSGGAARRAAIRPAEVSQRLVAAMLAPGNVLEDAHYAKIVPNDFWVELEPATYERYYRPIEPALREQWQRELLEALNTTNQRQGRREYRFGGPVRVSLRPTAAVPAGNARVYGQVLPAAEAAAESAPAARLELLPGGRQWAVREGLTTLGRDPGCDICLDLPRFQETPLISGQHAYVVGEGQHFRLYDGTPGGRPSRNGTFVNGQRVPRSGQLLREGDLIVLAALDPANPRPDAPGAAAFLFLKAGSHGTDE